MSIQAVLLGNAQDGGLPQPGCYCPQCVEARSDPRKRGRVVCLGLVDWKVQQTWLVDATPDFNDQLHALHQIAPDCPLSGIFLTHAHIGHYTGLMYLGREAWNTHRMPVYATRRMARFLGANAPWSQLIQAENIQLFRISPGRALQLSADLQLIPIKVPHRGEFSDTLALSVHGPKRRLFYCPDVDTWEDWERDPTAVLDGVDVALLDGTFFSADELPGRNLSEIPHPPITETVDRLGNAGIDKRFIHLNHSNPLHRAVCPQRHWLERQGFLVGERGNIWDLG